MGVDLVTSDLADLYVDHIGNWQIVERKECWNIGGKLKFKESVLFRDHSQSIYYRCYFQNTHISLKIVFMYSNLQDSKD